MLNSFITKEYFIKLPFRSRPLDDQILSNKALSNKPSNISKGAASLSSNPEVTRKYLLLPDQQQLGQVSLTYQRIIDWPHSFPVVA